MFIRLIVKHSSIPSRRLSAASGCSLSSHFAIFSSFAIPSFASSLQAARISDLVCACWSLGNRSATFRSLCWRHQGCASDSISTVNAIWFLRFCPFMIRVPRRFISLASFLRP